MGQVKEFGIWLAECVSNRHMSNAQIWSALQSRFPVSQGVGIQSWLDEQISAVKFNPELYLQPPSHIEKKGFGDDRAQDNSFEDLEQRD